MNASARVDVVIPVFNAWELTEQCLAALARVSGGGQAGVIVVDNGSADLTPQACPVLGKDLFGEAFRYIRFDINRNFGPACNAGAAASEAEFVCFLNNDTVPEPGWLEPLLAALGEDSTLGAVGPLLLYPGSRRVQHLGVAYDPLFNVEHLFHNFPENHPVVTHGRRLQALSAAAMLLPRAVFQDIGGFYEAYANGFEDLELCVALRRRGLGMMCVPEAKVLHLESQSEGRKDVDDANAALFSRRCKADIVPDLFDVVRDAGYAPAVTPWFETYASLPAARAGELAKMLQAGLDAGRVWELLQAEPLWGQGYALLASALESQGQLDQACDLRTLHQEMCPSLVNLRALALCAAKAGRAEMAARSMAYLKRYESLVADIDARKQRFHQISSELSGQPQDVLELYRDALASKF